MSTTGTTQVLGIEQLKEAVKTAAAIRYRVRLQPAGGPGDKAFPPTYQGGKYAEEERIIDGNKVHCVHLDSVQSQANRMELALLDAVRDKKITLPMVEVDFREVDGLAEMGTITSLEAPHRLADAILRDSLQNGVRFRESTEGKVLETASTKNASALFALDPCSLLFGLWDSTGPRGGLGVKFQRAVVSEIVAVDAVVGVKSASRIDPTAIEKLRDKIYKTDEEHVATEGPWTLNQELAEKEGGKPVCVGKKKEGNPSDINLGNVTPDLKNKDGQQYPGGFTFAYAMQTTVLSLPALRRLRFPVDGKSSAETDPAAQTVLAALALAAATLSISQGMSLRSRCDLIPEAPGMWEIVSGEVTPVPFALDSKQACELLRGAVGEAQKAGLSWKEKPLVLVPSDGLAELIRRSREHTAETPTEG